MLTVLFQVRNSSLPKSSHSKQINKKWIYLDILRDTSSSQPLQQAHNSQNYFIPDISYFLDTSANNLPLFREYFSLHPQLQEQLNHESAGEIIFFNITKIHLNHLMA